MANPDNNKKLQVLNLGLVSLFNDLSSEVIMRVLPLYLLTIVHASIVGIGTVEAIADSTATFGRIFSGFYSDKGGKRKPWIFFGYALSVFSRPLLLITTLGAAEGARFLDKVGKSVRTAPRDALIAELSDKSNRGKNFGINRALDTLGAVLGLLGVYVFLEFSPMEDKTALKYILAGASVVGLLALGVLFLVKEPIQQKVIKAKIFHFSWTTLDRDLKRYLFVAFFFALASSSDAFIILRAHDLNFSTKSLFLTLASFNIVSASTAYSLTKLSDSKGRKSLLFVGWSIYTGVYFLFGLHDLTKPAFILVLLLYGLFYAFTDGVEKALIADFEVGERKGEAYGWLGLVQGLAIIPANLVFAIMYQKLGSQFAFWSSAGVAVVGLILFAFFKPNKKEVMN
jgi:MFS family permease